jgi:hypothetical protein
MQLGAASAPASLGRVDGGHPESSPSVSNRKPEWIGLPASPDAGDASLTAAGVSSKPLHRPHVGGAGLCRGRSEYRRHGDRAGRQVELFGIKRRPRCLPERTPPDPTSTR